MVVSNTKPLLPMKPKTTPNGYTSETHDSTSLSPPPSPRHYSSLPHSRRRLNNCKSFSNHRRRFNSVTGIFLRRNLLPYILLLSILYVSGLITCVGPLSALLRSPPLPGSVYRSHEIFQKLWTEIESDNSSTIELSSIWRYRRKLKERKPCLMTPAARYFESPGPDRYLIVNANGGLNQQRSSICNAVAVAGLLNATLVIPQFDFHSVWRDRSEFSDIYDEDHFINTLDGYVNVVRELPKELMERYGFNISNITNFRVPAWAPASYYLDEVYPVLHKKRVIRISPFANRLAMNVAPHIQFLRCLANYEALRFSFPILTLANKLANRMMDRSSSYGGKYVSVHLRFEEDMVAFSCCVYDGGQVEKTDMDRIREKGWRGEIYQAERKLAPLRKMFPLVQTKESLATGDELATFQGYSSRFAALDYMVCLLSEVFVTTQGGNFPHFLMGHRRFLYNGHAKTIKPDKEKFVVLLHNTSISWKDFKDAVRLMLAESDRKGILVPRAKKSTRKTSIYSNPLPECRCLWESQNSSKKWTNVSHLLGRKFDP